MKRVKPFIREKNFMILITGVFINGIGSGIYMIAGMLLVLELSGSVLYSGFAMFAISLASALGFLIAPLANYTKYKNGLVFSNLIKALMLFTIPLMHYTIGLDVWYVIALLFITALLTQYTYPIESTILPIIVGEENVVEANSYLQTIREAMDIVFIASAGVIVLFVGTVNAVMITAVCILLISILYTLFSFQQPEPAKEATEAVKNAAGRYFNDLKAGFTYIKGSIIPKMIFSVIFLNMAMIILTTNMPAFSLFKGNGNESVYGFYLAALSLGIMLGTLITPRIKHFNFGKLIIFTFLGTGTLWLGTAMLPLIPSLILYSIGAMSIGIINILIFSTIQKQVETAYIGRVVTLITSAASLGMPVGALLGGVIGDTFHPTIAIIVTSVGMIIFSILWLTNSVLRTLPNIEEVRIFNNRPEESV